MSDTRVILSRYANVSLANPERWACAVAASCPITGSAGDSTTTHVVRVKKLRPRMDNYALSAWNEIWGFWVSSTRTDNGSTSTLGHQLYPAAGTGSMASLDTALADPAGTYGLALRTWGAPDVYRGHPLPIQFATDHLGGPTAPQIYVKTAVLNDGSTHTCTLSYTLITCADGITVQLIPTGMNYRAGSPSAGYLNVSSSCGPLNKPCSWSGDYTYGLSGTSGQAVTGYFLVNTSGTTTARAYTLTVTLQGANSGKDVGTGARFTYGFTVLPPATFSERAAASFPAMYNAANMQGYVGYFGYQYCQNPSLGQNGWNAVGLFENENYGASDRSLYFYDGPHLYFELADLVNAASTDWASGTLYPYGTIIKPTTGNAGGYVYYTYPTAGGPINGIGGSSTSAGSAPSWPQTYGATVADGNGTSYFNMGNRHSMNQCAEVVLDPYRHWLDTTQGAVMSEWNTTLNFGLLMDYRRTGDLKCQGSTTDGCSGGTAVLAGDAAALAPLVTSSGSATGSNLYSYVVYADMYNARAPTGMLDYAIANDLMNGTLNADTIGSLRVESALNVLREGSAIRSWGDTDYGSQSFPLGSAAHNFYPGIVMESLINYENLLILHNQYDARIPVVIKQFLDWQWSMSWAKAYRGTCGQSSYQGGAPCAMLYDGAAWPQNTTFDFADTTLNLLSGTFAYCWYWAVSGDTTYRDRCDLLVGHAADNPGHMYSQKAMGTYRTYLDMVNLRNGSFISSKNGHVYAEMGVMPDKNPCNSGEAWPCTIASTVGDDRIPPFNFTLSGSPTARHGNPRISGITSTGATIYWETPEPTAHSWVLYGSASNCSNTSVDVTSTTRISNFRWSHSVNLTGLAPNTTYFVQIKSKDEAANIAASTCSSARNSQYSFTTLKDN